MEIIEKLIIPQVYIPIFSIVIAIIINKIAKTIIKKVFKIKLGHADLTEKREKTLTSLVLSIIKIFVWSIAIITILNAFGINTASIITSLGVLGLAIGLGAQDAIKDFIAGFLIILDKKYNIGDVIEINGFKGEVIDLSLQTTKIKNWTGEIKIIFNRNINEVTNFSINNSLAVVDAAVSYNSDIKKVEKVLINLVKKLNKELEYLKGEVELLGIEKLGDSSINFRIIAPTEPMKHFEVQRTIRREIKLTFDKENIEIPYPQLDVHNK